MSCARFTLLLSEDASGLITGRLKERPAIVVRARTLDSVQDLIRTEMAPFLKPGSKLKLRPRVVETPPPTQTDAIRASSQAAGNAANEGAQ